MGLTKEERQIKEAFIDGFTSPHRCNHDEHVTEKQVAECAWHEENETHRDGTKRVHVDADALRMVLRGGAANQTALNAAVARLRDEAGLSS